MNSLVKMSKTMQGNNHESITLFDLVISYKNNRNWFTCITSFDYTITKLPRW